ncbi:hypothetical protein B0F90DRAFT_1757700 [Multifurca ochricompacta]|uniref:Secreted protein n=1 Tax=Multifurca ochricompacta TaxID=376703 RepID=A0AAD4LXG1_9AGAM|nr:hypothetical protein B0F90DRAFT_1757700 [Multifurca ochricompacta]
MTSLWHFFFFFVVVDLLSSPFIWDGGFDFATYLSRSCHISHVHGTGKLSFASFPPPPLPIRDLIWAGWTDEDERELADPAWMRLRNSMVQACN